MNAVKYLVCALLLAVISGCATGPISKNLRKQAKPVTFSQVRADPQGTRGTVVIWGGRIINVVNDTNGSSIYILCLPVDSDGEPVADAPSPGRFIAVSRGYLDPEMFPQRTRITVAGQLNGVWAEPLGKIRYPYPVVEVLETHIWPAESEQYPYYGNYYGPGWGWGWGWPWWGWYGGYPLYYGGYYHGGFHGHGGGGFHGEGGGGFHGEGGGGFHGEGGGGFHGGGGGGGGHGR